MGLDAEICASYMPGTLPCLGGVMALDGRTGNVLWQHWTHHSVLIVDCSTDITSDNTNDCIVSGKGGVSILILFKLSYVTSDSLSYINVQVCTLQCPRELNFH